jgi:hypothetical protein
MADAARSIAAALRESPETASLIARWEATQRAAQCIAPVCRSLASGFDPLVPGRCELRDAVLWLNPTSTAQSAKLRQAMPTLLLCLRTKGVQVYEIKFRVQAGVMPYPGQGSHVPSSSSDSLPAASVRAIDAVSELALTVGASPLKLAAARLAATLRKRLVSDRNAQQNRPDALPSEPPTD